METALITGASDGIGLELARIMAQNGYNLVIVARNRDKLNMLASELCSLYNTKVHVIAKDLSLPGAPCDVMNDLDAGNINVDILINNAGFGDFGMFADSDWNKMHSMIELNITALTYLTRLCLPYMISKGKGRIMNVSSTAAFQPGPLMSVYYATKAYVQSFTEAISNELEIHGITVTALCPGPTISGFQKAASLDGSRLFKNRRIPSSREVALFGYDAMLNGRRVAVHGTLNRLMSLSVRFAPKGLLLKVVRFIQEKTKAQGRN